MLDAGCWMLDAVIRGAKPKKKKNTNLIVYHDQHARKFPFYFYDSF
eukprot:COSAG01_NODE_5839_length_4003_cov_2.371414_3_plen_46_part_00